MGYRTLRECVQDLEKHGHLVRFDEPVDAVLEVAEIQRRVYANQGPAVLFTNVSHSAFPVVSNLFGTLERSRFMFRDTWERVQRLIAFKADPASIAARPWQIPRV
ncbi:MAG: 3-octaprenyl-4-hydroxybenzoate carboxy-lyase, partial [Pirellulaceae bacterium]